jgi:flagellar motor protein MotB
MEDETFELNFWPSFADLMLALVLVLVLLLFLFAGVLSIGTVNLEKVHERQVALVESIAHAYDVKASQPSTNLYVISIEKNGSNDIDIRNEPTLQKITFSDNILFDPNEYQINDRGQTVLRTVGDVLKSQLSDIREIQIQGHADTDQTSRFPSNTHLAALRAIEVLNHLKDVSGIDPAEHLMSATSFGEFDPVQRGRDEVKYSRERLLRDNSTVQLKAQNRRIELLLFYRL